MYRYYSNILSYELSQMIKKFKTQISKILPISVKNIRYRYKWKVIQHEKYIDSKIFSLKNSGRPIKILFIISSLPMWRSQRLYELLIADDRFDPKIIICPFKRYNEEERVNYINEISAYLSSCGVNDYVIDDKDFDLDQFLNADFNPDIIFPSQGYNNIYGNKLDLEWNRERIYCNIPYALMTVLSTAYNHYFQNLCWKFYIPSALHLKTAKKMMANHAKNVIIVGEPDYDKFVESKRDPWKMMKDGKKRKRVIWAPHFSIGPKDTLHRASFLWLYDEMLKIAYEYRDSIQFVFKPHPHLHNAICNFDCWGEDWANQYYDKWSSMENTQLEEGYFTDLFKFSDAMIHDCGSFTGEYMFVNKPVMFTTQNEKFIREGADDFGLKCLDLHYIGKSIDDIRNFLDNIVIKENDNLKEERSRFYQEYLIPPNGKSVAENIYDDLLKSFGFSKNNF